MTFHPSMEKISSYLDGNLSDAVRKKVQGHVEHCEKCNKEVQLLKATEQLLQAPKVKINSITKNVMGKIQDRKWNTSREFVSEIKSVMGKAAIHSGTKGENFEAFPGCALRKGVTLLTLGESKALVEHADGSQIYINQETELDFQTSGYPLTLRLGEIFSMMKPQKEVFEIQTPSAVLSVIGTDFDTEVNKEKQTSLKVFKGKVGYKNKAGDVLVKKNQQVEAMEYTKPSVTAIQEKQNVTKWVTSIKSISNQKGEIMKKLEILIVVLIVGIGGYLLYQKNHQSQGVVLQSSIPNQNISIEYHPVENIQGKNLHRGMSIRSNGYSLTFTGTGKLKQLIENIARNDANLSWDGYIVEVQPEVNKEYEITNLNYPIHVSLENILTPLGKEMGFQTIIKETTIQAFHAVRNDQPITLTKSSITNGGQKVFENNAKLKFTNFSINNLLANFKEKGLFISDETGVTDKFDGEIQIDGSIDDIKRELETKLGIDLVPYDKTIKLILIQST